MIDFAWPTFFLLLPAPYIIYRYFSASNSTAAQTLHTPNFIDFDSFKAPKHKFSLKNVILWLAWLCLILAAARPQVPLKPLELTKSGRDLMLAVDISPSMQIQDFVHQGKYLDRLSMTKLVVKDFIAKRAGDRIGLVLFGSEAYVQAPPTFDTKTVFQLLTESEIGLAGNGTAIGNAIALAIKQLQKSAASSRVLILLTDGQNNSGEISPEKATEIAAREKLKIHTIGIGAENVKVQTPFGLQNIAASSDLDEKSLKNIAETTGGRYFRAYDSNSLKNIYAEIDKLEEIDQKESFFKPIQELYFWPLAVAIFLIFTLIIINVYGYVRFSLR